ncbi:MAG TPA: site-2 protease family protein, partial [Promineifilum sp.]|nr:site-2 protease family protein [Promineifilum sp.]
IACFADAARDLDKLIDEEVKASGLSMASDARAALRALIGGDRLASRGEVQKLMLYAADKGEITAEEARPVSIIGISQIAGGALESSVVSRNPYRLLIMAAFISVALGLTNLLPIPALDGGRILFVLIEAIRGRRIEPQREGMVHLIGMLMLLGLMAFLIFQDIFNPIVPLQ